ncbi:MAG TPA: cytochrome c biogenesis protein CcsA [Verrucomicrobiae bacterium]|jgi:ABC-type transport system involved in cytochrome c biogenesis permease subunit|nr:cytochrome c biogenesis protein CcsA [Verrucomicrobiae bacterium]
MKKWLPIILTGVMAAWFLSTLRPVPDKTFAFTEFGKLPILSSGRVQPIDSLARNSLLQIREKQEANLEPWKGTFGKPRIIPANEWLATVMMNPAVADQWPVFRVDNQELISLLKLPGKDLAQKHDGKHYSWNEIQPGLKSLDSETTRIEKIETAQRNVYEKSVMKVRERLWLYVQLKNSVQPENADNWAQEVADYEKLIPAGVAAAQAEQAGRKYDEAVLKQFAVYVQQFTTMAQFEPPLIIPPQQAGDSWKRTGEVLTDALRDGKIAPAVHAYAAMASAFQAGDSAEFNRQLVLYRESLAHDFSHEVRKARAEVFFNQMQPFYNAMVIYVLAGVLAFCFWFNLSEALRRSAVWLIGLAFVIHTTGLVFRMVLEGRPPVTNLYSSAIFIGFGAVVLGLVLERFYKNGIGAVVASGIGFITLIIAQHLAVTGDTMEMMRAVLDTNFWLATHVVVVTLGYASTFVAGFLAIVYILRGVFTRTLDAETGKSLGRMVYGIVCFATLFSFVGTVLGGIWADQSWGRFWGWDPKENGALIIVLWNALILHLRWGGMIRERGLINCAIFGNIVTSWSWFGVNMLGIGLHSYGFMDAAFYWLLGFVGSQLALIALGCMPLRLWKSFRGRAIQSTPEPGGPPAGEPAAA